MNARAALLALALFACKKTSPPATVTSRDAAVTAAVDAAIGFRIAPGVKQLVTAIVDDWSATHATLQQWRRDQGPWRAVGDPWPAVVGRAGTAWGRGLHGDGAPPGTDGPRKQEGDRKSPAGVFALYGAYGYADAPAGTTVPYQQVTKDWKCVDDPRSRAYNQILDARTVTPDWSSAEDMRRDDAHYTYVVDVGHNRARTPGDGSCIFLHVWGGPDSTTVGCTAMDEPVLAMLIAALVPADHPAFVLLPRATYDALAPAWDLPR